MTALPKELEAALQQGRQRSDPRKKSKTDRGDRYLLGGLRQKLVLQSEHKGFKTRVFTDDGSRIPDALRAGYVPILKNEDEWDHDAPVEMDQWLSMIVDREPEPRRGYFMKIKNELYEEDQAEKQREIDKIDQAIAGENIDEVTGSNDLKSGKAYVKTLNVQRN